MDKNIRLFFYAGGIFVCYFYYGVVQERITRGVYGKTPETQEKFKCVLALVFVQCVTNWLYAHLLLRTVMKQGENVTPTIYLCSCALTYLLAMICSTMALQWVSYPTQVIGKSGKPIPVMILGVLLGRKSYPLQKYLFVLLIVIGVALFMYKDGKSSQSATGSFGIGEMLLILSLTMDGILGAIQERMRAEHKTKSLHMMSSINKWSIVFVGIAILYTGEMIDFFGFVQRHPSLIWELLTFSVASALGQLFIFLMVEHFGPLPCSIVTTTRKFFTVFGSIIFFGNSLSYRQWIATFVVFSGLFLDSLYGKKPTEKTVNKQDDGCNTTTTKSLLTTPTSDETDAEAVNSTDITVTKDLLLETRTPSKGETSDVVTSSESTSADSITLILNSATTESQQPEQNSDNQSRNLS